jgi:hypothetical protein
LKAIGGCVCLRPLRMTSRIIGWMCGPWGAEMGK